MVILHTVMLPGALNRFFFMHQHPSPSDSGKPAPCGFGQASNHHPIASSTNHHPPPPGSGKHQTINNFTGLRIAKRHGHLIPHTSYLIPPTSYLLPPTSYLIPPTSSLLCQIPIHPSIHLLHRIRPEDDFVVPVEEKHGGRREDVIILGHWAVPFFEIGIAEEGEVF